MAVKHGKKCEKCGALLVNIVSGAVCPAGCGGIVPKVSGDDHLAGLKASRVKSLPKAVLLTRLRAIGDSKDEKKWSDHRLWTVESELGIFRRVSRTTSSLLQEKQTPGNVLAYYDKLDKVVLLAHYRPGEVEVAVACSTEGDA